MKRLALVAAMLFLSQTAALAYSFFQYDENGSTKTRGSYTYPVFITNWGDPVWEEVDDPWVFVDTTNIRLMTGSQDFEFFLASYTSDGPSNASQATAVENALDEWDSELGSNLSVTWGGVDTNLDFNGNDTTNVVVFSDLDDLEDIAGEALIKVITWREDTGEIREVDILLNEDYDWSVGTHDCPVTTTDKLDIQSVVTHELGHALGIGHPNGSFTGCPSMLTGSTSANGTCSPSCASDTESLGMRSLEADDRDAIAEMYGSGGADSKSVVSEEGGDIAPKAVASGAALSTMPASFSLESVHPNPFNPSTTITFLMPTEAAPRIEVFSATGQVVRVLTTGTLPTGRHQLEWDGLDASSREVASGVYIVVMKVGDVRESLKVTLLR